MPIAQNGFLIQDTFSCQMFLKSDVIQSMSCSVTCITSYALSLYMYDPQNTHCKDSTVKGATTEIIGCTLFNERNQVMETSYCLQ